jgi:hypothetical protein
MNRIMPASVRAEVFNPIRAAVLRHGTQRGVGRRLTTKVTLWTLNEMVWPSVFHTLPGTLAPEGLQVSLALTMATMKNSWVWCNLYVAFAREAACDFTLLCHRKLRAQLRPETAHLLVYLS